MNEELESELEPGTRWYAFEEAGYIEIKPCKIDTQDCIYCKDGICIRTYRRELTSTTMVTHDRCQGNN